MFGRLANCLKRNCYCAPFLIVWLYLQPCRGTAVVVVVTPSGIVIGADGKTVTPPKCGTTDPEKFSTALKVILLKKKIVLSDIGFEQVKDEDTGSVLYDFPTWATYVDQKLEPGATVSGLVPIIENQIPTTLMSTFHELDRSACVWEHGGFMDGKVAVQYVLVGYESGAPMVYSIYF